MPANLIKTYNQLLDLLYPTFKKNLESIRKVFDRDFTPGDISFNTYPVSPAPKEGQDKMEILFSHLTTEVIDEATRKRTFEQSRAVRLHWVRYHLEESKQFNAYEVDEDNKVYIVNKAEKYVVILEWLRNKTRFYLLTAYPLYPNNYKKILTRLEKRGRPF
jgi:hypothetical protein